MKKYLLLVYFYGTKNYKNNFFFSAAQVIYTVLYYTILYYTTYIYYAILYYIYIYIYL